MKLKERKKSSSKNDILDEEEISLIINEAAHNLKAEFITKAILFGGLRAGEVGHMRKEWWNQEKNTIDIPQKQPCSCRDCRIRELSTIVQKKWKKDFPNPKEIKENGFSVERLKKAIREREDYKTEFGKIVTGFWEPKTSAGIRHIPIVYSEFKDVLLKFFSKYSQVGMTRYRVWQIITKVAVDAGVRTDVRDVYPHCIRATCASLWGQKQVSPATMCKMFGWDNISSADPYITIGSEKAIEEANKQAGDSLW